MKFPKNLCKIEVIGNSKAITCLIWYKSTSKSAFYDTLRIFTNANG